MQTNEVPSGAASTQGSPSTALQARTGLDASQVQAEPAAHPNGQAQARHPAVPPQGVDAEREDTRQ